MQQALGLKISKDEQPVGVRGDCKTMTGQMRGKINKQGMGGEGRGGVSSLTAVITNRRHSCQKPNLGNLHPCQVCAGSNQSGGAEVPT